VNVFFSLNLHTNYTCSFHISTLHFLLHLHSCICGAILSIPFPPKLFITTVGEVYYASASAKSMQLVGFAFSCMYFDVADCVCVCLLCFLKVLMCRYLKTQ